MAKLQKGVNDLESWRLNNGEFGQKLMTEWTGICDDGSHYRIDEVSRGSHKKFKWRCSKEHEWFAKINDRTAYKTDCPYCYKTNRGEIVSKSKLSNENSLKTWCLNSGSWGKQLLSEWTGECTDGKHYKIDEVAKASNKKFKWKCGSGHEWLTTVNNRTSLKHGCPYCSGRRVSNKNSLKTWCLNNGSWGKQLMSEWTGECEDNQCYAIDQVSFGSSNKKFKWRCSKKHEWFAMVRNRTTQKQGCPYCSGNYASNENSLKTWCLSNGSFGKQLMSEWTGECTDGRHYKTDEVTRGSHKKFKWICSKGHEWTAQIINRTSLKHGCPYCLRAKPKKGLNDLETWCLNNGSFGEQLKSEWTGICEDGAHYKIDEVSFGSYKKFKWKCSKRHEWLANVKDRTRQRQGCPCCTNIGTSYPEQFIYHSLKQIYPNTENRCKVLKSQQNTHGVEFDIGIPDIPLCIEYSPTYWHEGKEERDQYKKELCEQCGVRLIQIVEDSHDELEHITSDDYICFKMKYSQQDEILTEIVDHILKTLGHSISEIDIERVKKNAWDFSKGYIDSES